jgi:hypothetical protein
MVMVRPGRSSLGCLVVLLVLAAAGYFAVNVGEVYIRFYEFRDDVRQEARFARMRSDDDIRARLAAKADSLDLPAEAGRVRIYRTAGRITLTSEYTELVELPLFVREFDFSIREEGAL